MEAIKQCLVSVENQPKQSSVLNILTRFATHQNITEYVLLHCFQINLFFLIRVESMVVKEAMLCADNMCTKFGTAPSHFLNWHKETIFKILIKECVINWLQHGFGIHKTFKK